MAADRSDRVAAAHGFRQNLRSDKTCSAYQRNFHRVIDLFFSESIFNLGTVRARRRVRSSPVPVPVIHASLGPWSCPRLDTLEARERYTDSSPGGRGYGPDA